VEWSKTNSRFKELANEGTRLVRFQRIERPSDFLMERDPRGSFGTEMYGRRSSFLDPLRFRHRAHALQGRTVGYLTRSDYDRAHVHPMLFQSCHGNPAAAAQSPDDSGVAHSHSMHREPAPKTFESHIRVRRATREWQSGLRSSDRMVFILAREDFPQHR